MGSGCSTRGVTTTSDPTRVVKPDDPAVDTNLIECAGKVLYSLIIYITHKRGLLKRLHLELISVVRKDIFQLNFV